MPVIAILAVVETNSRQFVVEKVRLNSLMVAILR